MADPRFDQGWKWDDSPSPQLTSPIAFPDLPTVPKASATSRVVPRGNQDKKKKEKEEPEDVEDEKVVVPKKSFKKIKEIIVQGLEEQDKKRKGNKGCGFTIDFLTALSDTLKYYNADDEDHTEFVTRFHEAWKEQHARAGSLDMADIVRETSTVDYQVLKDFHDAPCAASNKKAEKGSKEKVKKGKEAKKEKEGPEEAQEVSKDKAKKGKEAKKEKERPQEAEEGTKDKVKKGKEAKKEETEEAENGSEGKVKKGKEPKKEKKEPEEVEKGSKDKKVRKGKEAKKEKEEPEEAEDVKIVIPKTTVDRIKAIVECGMDDQSEKGFGQGCLHTKEFLRALDDALEYYDDAEDNQTEFVIRFHNAWKKKHSGCSNLAEILQSNSAVNYKELKHFHDAFWDATKDKPKFTDLYWKGAKGTATSVKAEKNDEPMMRMGTRNNKSTRDDESRNNKSTRDDESRNNKSPRDDESRNKKSPRD